MLIMYKNIMATLYIESRRADVRGGCWPLFTTIVYSDLFCFFLVFFSLNYCFAAVVLIATNKVEYNTVIVTKNHLCTVIGRYIRINF